MNSQQNLNTKFVKLYLYQSCHQNLTFLVLRSDTMFNLNKLKSSNWIYKLIKNSQIKSQKKNFDITTFHILKMLLKNWNFKLNYEHMIRHPKENHEKIVYQNLFKKRTYHVWFCLQFFIPDAINSIIFLFSEANILVFSLNASNTFFDVPVESKRILF